MAIAPVSFTEHITKIIDLQAGLEIKKIETKALKEHVKLLEEHVGLLEEALRQPRSENHATENGCGVEDNHGVDSDREVEGVSDLRETIAYLQDCIKRQAETLRKQVGTIFDYQDKIKKLDEEADRNTKRQSETIQSQNNTIQTLLKEKVILQDDLKTQGNLLKNQAETIKKNLNQIADLESTVQSWKDRYTESCHERKSLLDQLKEAREINLSCETKIDQHLKEINLLKDQESGFLKIIDEFKSKIKFSEDKNQESKNEIEVLRTKIAQRPDPRDFDPVPFNFARGE